MSPNFLLALQIATKPACRFGMIKQLRQKRDSFAIPLPTCSMVCVAYPYWVVFRLSGKVDAKHKVALSKPVHIIGPYCEVL